MTTDERRLADMYIEAKNQLVQMEAELINAQDLLAEWQARADAAEMERDALRAVVELSERVAACLCEFADHPEACAEWTERLDAALAALDSERAG